MKPSLGLLLRLFLSLALCVLGPGTSAYAMAANGPERMVICGETGTSAVWIDASGAASDTAPDCRTCPDCLSAADMPALLPPVHLPVALQKAPPGLILPVSALPILPAHLRPDPRGPPVLAPLANGPIDAVRSVPAIAPASLEFGQVMRGQSMPDRRATD